MATTPRSRSTAPPERARPSTAQALRGPLIALALVGLLAIVAIVWGPGDAGEGSSVAEVQGGGAGAPADSQARRVPDDPLSLGDVDAPVVLVMWEDFQCPFCATFALERQEM